MERQARFVVMGLFMLAFAAAIFVSVYWLHGFGTFGAAAVYTVRFQGVSPGVGVGASVLFNGVRVGEVVRVSFSPDDPDEVLAQIAIDPRTPVRVDTMVGVDTPGLMGGSVISLRGGGLASPAPSGVGGAPPMLNADPLLVVGLSETARGVLLRIDKLLADNSDSLHTTISNIQVFSDVLARNSGRVDAILQGLQRMTGGAAKGPAPMYDLAAPTEFPPLKRSSANLTVGEPTAVVMFESQHVLLKGKDGGSVFLEDAQWSDSLVKLVQAKLVVAFENSQAFASVSRAIEGGAPDNQIIVDIRGFSVWASSTPTADVAIGAKLLSADGKIVAEREFHRSTPIASTAAGDAVAGLNAAFVGVETDLVAWTCDAL